jgi:hypothetical protein
MYASLMAIAFGPLILLLGISLKVSSDHKAYVPQDENLHFRIAYNSK